MVLGYVPTGENYSSKNGIGFGGRPYQYQPEEYYSENAYHNNNGGSSLQQVKPYSNITTSQPPKNYVVVPDQGYNVMEHESHGGGGYYDKHSSNIIKDGYYKEHESHGGYSDKHSNAGKNHEGSYDNYESHGLAKYSDGPNRGETMRYSYYAEGRDRCPSSSSYYDHHHKKSQQNWGPNMAAEWIVKALDD